jgi:hypothetical protein
MLSKIYRIHKFITLDRLRVVHYYPSLGQASCRRSMRSRRDDQHETTCHKLCIKLLHQVASDATLLGRPVSQLLDMVNG